MVTTQIKYMFKKKGFWIAFSLMQLYSFLTFLYYIIKYWGHDFTAMNDVRELTIISESSRFFGYFEMVFPFLIVFPFATSVFEDLNNKSYTMWVYRKGKRNYFLAKGIANIIGGFLAVTVPMLMNICLTFMVFPKTNVTGQGIIGLGAFEHNAFGRITFIKEYIFYPMTYEIIMAVVMGMFASLVSFWAFAFALNIKKYKIIIFAPVYFIFWMLNVLDNQLNDCWNLMSYVTVQFCSGKSYVLFVAICLVITIIAGVNLIFRTRREL